MMFTLPQKVRPPILICISDTRACYWIVLTQLITGIILLIYQSEAVFMDCRGIGLWWEAILLADVFLDFITAAIALGGYKSLIENTIYPILFLKTFRFCFYCAVLTTILLTDCYSEESEFYLDHVISEYELTVVNKNSSLRTADQLSIVLLMSLMIYPISCCINAPPSTRAVIYMIYLPLSMVFQGLSAILLSRRIGKIRKMEFDKSINDWAVERAAQRAAKRSNKAESTCSWSEKSPQRTEWSDEEESRPYWMPKQSTKQSARPDRGESSRSTDQGASSRVSWLCNPFPKPTTSKQKQCPCCPPFEFGCLQKLTIIDEDEDDYD